MSRPSRPCRSWRGPEVLPLRRSEGHCYPSRRGPLRLPGLGDLDEDAVSTRSAVLVSVPLARHTETSTKLSKSRVSDPWMTWFHSYFSDVLYQRQGGWHVQFARSRLNQRNDGRGGYSSPQTTGLLPQVAPYPPVCSVPENHGSYTHGSVRTPVSPYQDWTSPCLRRWLPGREGTSSP